jgi:glutamyl-tRNA reductase
MPITLKEFATQSGVHRALTRAGSAGTIASKRLLRREGRLAELRCVGLGTMGGRVALRLLKAGHRVGGHNRTPERVRWLIEEPADLVG